MPVLSISQREQEGQHSRGSGLRVWFSDPNIHGVEVVATHPSSRARWSSWIVLLIPLLVSCTTFNPVPLEQVAFKARAETKSTDRATVTAAVPSAEETSQVFGAKLYRKGIQPIWLEITNKSDGPMVFVSSSLDPDQFSPLEAAQKAGFTWRKESQRTDADLFLNNRIRLEIAAGETTSGFVFANRSLGVRLVVAEVVGPGWREHVEFPVGVPGFKADFDQVDPATLYQGQEIVDIDEQGLRSWIEQLPCCITNADGSKAGDPLNLVIIGTGAAIWPAFARAGWEPTETLRFGSAVKTAIRGVFGGAYRNAPISSLYVFGRSQDLAL